MILFPYAKDIEYDQDDKTIAFTLTLFNNENTVDIKLTFECNDIVSKTIEDFLEDRVDIGREVYKCVSQNEKSGGKNGIS